MNNDRILNDPHDSPSPNGGSQKPFRSNPNSDSEDDPSSAEWGSARPPPGVAGRVRGGEKSGGGVSVGAVKDQVVEGLNKAREAAGRLGSYGEDGFHRPRSAEEKMRKGTPYSECMKALHAHLGRFRF